MLKRFAYSCRLNWLNAQLSYYRTFAPLLIWCSVQRGIIKDIFDSLYCLYRLLRTGYSAEKAAAIIQRRNNILALRMALSNTARRRKLNHDAAVLAERFGIAQHDMRTYLDL